MRSPTDGDDHLSGPNTLLRFLRSPDDPSQNGGPSKIGLATRAWQMSTPQIPAKAEILKEWILSTWDQKWTDSAQNPITQLSYLDLLQSILSRSPAALSPRHLTRYLDALADTPQLGTGHPVWVTGLQECEASSDLWVHAYIRMLRCLAQPAVALDAELVSMVEDRVIRAVTVAQASKKSNAFTLASMPDIADAFAQHALLRSDVLGAVIWPVSLLKISKSITSVLSTLRPTSDSLAFLPRLIQGYTTVLQANQRDLFVQPTLSRSSYGSFLQERTRNSLNIALGEIRTYIRAVGKEGPLFEEKEWECRTQLWQSIESSGLYLETAPEWTSLLAQDTQEAANILRGQPAIELVKSIMAFLAVAEHLDHATTSINPASIAWCLAAPTGIHAEAESLLLATLRYHVLSQTPAAWFSIILEAVDALISDAHSVEVAQSIQQLVVRGPLFGDRLQRDMSQIRQKRPIVDTMTIRLRNAAKLVAPTAAAMDVVSRCCALLFPLSEDLFREILAAFEHAMSVKRTSGQGAMSMETELCLAATIRVGRAGDAIVRASLDEVHDLKHVVLHAQTAELRVESFLWATSRLCDLEDTIKLLDVVVSALASQMSLWQHVDLDTLVVLNSLASETQLDSICRTILTRESVRSYMSTVADVLELPRFAHALTRAIVQAISGTDMAADMLAIISSLPVNLFTPEARRAVVSAAVLADAKGTTAVKESLRYYLCRFPNGSFLHLEADYWALLESDIEHDVSRGPTEQLMKTCIRSAIHTEDEVDRLLSLTRHDTVRLLFAEVAIENDLDKLSGPARRRLELLAKELHKRANPDMSSRMRLGIAKLSRRCQLPDLTLVKRPTIFDAAELELLRSQCLSSEDELELLRILLDSDNRIHDDLLRTEAASLAHQSSDYAALMQSCMLQAASSMARGADTRRAFVVIAALLGVRRQGSGKVVVHCREVLVTLLTGTMSPSESQGLAIKALVRYRANVLRLTDAARIISSLGSSPGIIAIDVVHAIVLARSDLMVHILPTLVRFICGALRVVREDTANPLARLISSVATSRRSGTGGRGVSLNGPISKHAPLILVEYVRCLTTAPITKRMLQSSIFKICDTAIRLHDRGREGEGLGTPYGLGEAGDAEKEVWADLWGQWARYRYKGTG